MWFASLEAVAISPVSILQRLVRVCCRVKMQVASRRHKNSSLTQNDARSLGRRLMFGKAFLSCIPLYVSLSLPAGAVASPLHVEELISQTSTVPCRRCNPPPSSSVPVTGVNPSKGKQSPTRSKPRCQTPSPPCRRTPRCL